ncbi:energy transducer TonB [Photobacterium frigidiphilum]|uniref:Energy transducer TonB n=1 Tax=Photobacterium frigidiphilum TaxID=264736 RepID=A0A2T3JKI2_9GAMM|nr:energy transducer TonB [Photobacterium frigidiphilum]PSU49509.1 energy transducer TonB [Photobacterium frigidiphilum]
MNTKRYVIAGATSILFHGILLSAIPNKNAMAMPVGAESIRVSLNLVSSPQVAASQPIKQDVIKQAVQKTPPKKVLEPVETKTKKLVKKSDNKPKVIKKVKPTPPTEKSTPKKVVEKKTPKKTETVKKAPAKIIDKPTSEVTKTEQQATKSEVSSGANSPALVSKPTFATRPSPVKYPRLAKRRGVQGEVMVEVWIDQTGRQIKQTLLASSGTSMLDKAALDAIKKWQFSSHIVDGQAIAHRVQIPVRFQLD